MKKIIFVVFTIFSLTLQAKNYYVSSVGNNANDGLTPATAWQTISKVNTFSFAPNDAVLFQRGNTFYGNIIVKQSNLTYGAYGTGANPTITGLSSVTGWIKLSGNIWEAPVVNVKAGVNLVLRNNVIQQVGRYPNVSAANGGYLTYTAATQTSITGPALSSTTNWTGAEVAIKLNRWSVARQTVTSHSGGVVNFTANPDVPRLNYGYFFQRDSRTLDMDGEWWHNIAANKLRLYSISSPSAYTIQIATIDTLFKCQGFSNLTVNGLSFNGSGKRTIWINGGSSITITNCSITNSGAEAITAKSTSNVTISNCTITNSLGSGINLLNASTGSVNFLVQNCTVLNTAFMAGMETSNESNGGEGIICLGGNGINILNNSVTNSGYSGIKWQGNNVYIKYNLVDRFCTLRDDGAGIYSFEAAALRKETRFNRNVISNIVVNGIGSGQGANNTSTAAQGIYFDLGLKNVLIDSNTVAYIANGAFHGNDCSSLTLTNNVFFGSARSSSLQRFPSAELIRNIVIKKNIMYPYTFRYSNLAINSPAMTKEADIYAMGTFDSNYYALKAGTDRSLATITTNADNSDYKEEYFAFSYLTGTVGIEKHSVSFANTGTLEYNASNTAKTVSFTGLSKKDVYGNVYNNSAIIPAWSSKVLIPNGSATTSNKPPVANAGNGLTILLPIATVTLTGTGSDADGTVAKYSWAKISGPAVGTIVSPLSAVTVLLNLAAGTYKYQLTVTDDKGATGKDTVQVTVNSSTTLLPAVNPSNTVNGLNYKYYQGTWLKLPAFSSLTAVKTGTVLNFDLSPALITENYGFSFTGYISVPTDGMYTFYTNSDDGSNLLIDNVPVVANDGLHGPIEAAGTIGLKAGKHAITGLYFQKGGGATFFVSYSSAGIVKQRIPAASLYRINSTAIARVAGEKSLNGTAVSINSTTDPVGFKSTVYPNPSNTEFNLLVQGQNNEKALVSVTDASGKMMLQNMGTTNTTYKFGKNFAPGVYFIKIMQGAKLQTLKMVKL